jgi:hypothetical protein
LEAALPFSLADFSTGPGFGAGADGPGVGRSACLGGPGRGAVCVPPWAAAAGLRAPPDFFLLSDWLLNASWSRRTTGASIVEEADRTNSPMSWSLAITTLLSTPISLASS